jgi:cytoskeletal protein RodZ
MAVFGDTLKQARSFKGVTIREAEAATRINRHHLAALEAESFDGLPPLIYLRGFVKSYATYLGLDPVKVLELFEEARGERPEDPKAVSALQQVQMPNHFAPNFAIVAFIVFASAIVFAWMYSAYFAPSEATSTPTEFIATVTPADTDSLFIPSPTPAPPTATATSEPEPTETNEPEPTATEEPADNSQEIVDNSSDSADEQNVDETSAADSEPTSEPESSSDLPTGVATIQITALADIYVEFVADGTSVFSGNLAAGESTDAFQGSTFTVYTSSGVNTQFTNDEGEVFLMGYEEGEATYDMTAD